MTEKKTKNFEDTKKSEITVAYNLFQIDKKEYGEKYLDHLLEQYKQCLALADKVSDRRATTNTYFLALNVGLLAFVGSIFEKTNPYLFILFGFTDLIICFIWIGLIQHYHDLNKEKFNIIDLLRNKVGI
jgi:hypothetical protein